MQACVFSLRITDYTATVVEAAEFESQRNPMVSHPRPRRGSTGWCAGGGLGCREALSIEQLLVRADVSSLPP